jgi:hypothetical protein
MMHILAFLFLFLFLFSSQHQPLLKNNKRLKNV